MDLFMKHEVVSAVFHVVRLDVNVGCDLAEGKSMPPPALPTHATYLTNSIFEFITEGRLERTEIKGTQYASSEATGAYPIRSAGRDKDTGYSEQQTETDLVAAALSASVSLRDSKV